MYLLQIAFLIASLVVYLGAGFRQEAIFRESFDEQGNVFIFRNGVPDLSIYPLDNVVQYCLRGMWVTCAYPNYKMCAGGIGSTLDTLTCYNDTYFTQFSKSIRFVGAPETTREAISLYTEEFYSGEEIHVTRSAYAGITQNITSFAITGRTNWTLFEGINFNGKSYCNSGAVGDSHIWWAGVPFTGLRTVGSVYKSCNFDENDLKRARAGVFD